MIPPTSCTTAAPAGSWKCSSAPAVGLFESIDYIARKDGNCKSMPWVTSYCVDELCRHGCQQRDRSDETHCVLVLEPTQAQDHNCQQRSQCNWWVFRR